MNLTQKQIAIMDVVLAGDGTTEDGKFRPVDLDQLIERLSYQTTKQSIQFSIRALIKHGLVFKAGTENRRDRRRVLIAPTDRAMRFLRPKTSESWLTEEGAGPSVEEILEAAS